MQYSMWSESLLDNSSSDDIGHHDPTRSNSALGVFSGRKPTLKAFGILSLLHADRRSTRLHRNPDFAETKHVASTTLHAPLGVTARLGCSLACPAGCACSGRWPPCDCVIKGEPPSIINKINSPFTGAHVSQRGARAPPHRLLRGVIPTSDVFGAPPCAHFHFMM